MRFTHIHNQARKQRAAATAAREAAEQARAEAVAAREAAQQVCLSLSDASLAWK